MEIGLYYAIRGSCYGLKKNPKLFIALVEMHNRRTGTFFTPIGEMGLTLHEMYDISRLPWGDEPYEEYTPTGEEFEELDRRYPDFLAVYQEVLCHHSTCQQISKKKDKSTEGNTPHGSGETEGHRSLVSILFDQLDEIWEA